MSGDWACPCSERSTCNMTVVLNPQPCGCLQVRDADWYDPENKGDFEEIDVEFLNANPGVPHSVWLNSYHR